VVPRRGAGDAIVVTSAEAVAHHGQAEEYLRSAEAALLRGDHNAASGHAVDAAINAGDAVAGASIGQRWKGAHDQASAFVASSGMQGKEVARELRRLIPLKNKAHYEAAGISSSTAVSAVAAARRAVRVSGLATARLR
jgi:hypothetical protein